MGKRLLRYAPVSEVLQPLTGELLHWVLRSGQVVLAKLHAVDTRSVQLKNPQGLVLTLQFSEIEEVLQDKVSNY